MDAAGAAIESVRGSGLISTHPQEDWRRSPQDYF
jgi:hypothetical protein